MVCLSECAPPQVGKKVKCRWCKRRRASRPRDACRKCYGRLERRRSRALLSNKPRGNRFSSPDASESPLDPNPSFLPRGTEAWYDMLAERAQKGYQLYNPLDRPLWEPEPESDAAEDDEERRADRAALLMIRARKVVAA